MMLLKGASQLVIVALLASIIAAAAIGGYYYITTYAPMTGNEATTTTPPQNQASSTTTTSIATTTTTTTQSMPGVSGTGLLWDGQKYITVTVDGRLVDVTNGETLATVSGVMFPGLDLDVGPDGEIYVNPSEGSVYIVDGDGPREVVPGSNIGLYVAESGDIYTLPCMSSPSTGECLWTGKLLHYDQATDTIEELSLGRYVTPPPQLIDPATLPLELKPIKQPSDIIVENGFIVAITSDGLLAYTRLGWDYWVPIAYGLRPSPIQPLSYSGGNVIVWSVSGGEWVKNSMATAFRLGDWRAVKAYTLEGMNGFFAKYGTILAKEAGLYSGGNIRVPEEIVAGNTHVDRASIRLFGGQGEVVFEGSFPGHPSHYWVMYGGAYFMLDNVGNDTARFTIPLTRLYAMTNTNGDVVGYEIVMARTTIASAGTSSLHKELLEEWYDGGAITFGYLTDTLWKGEFEGTVPGSHTTIPRKDLLKLNGSCLAIGSVLTIKPGVEWARVTGPGSRLDVGAVPKLNIRLNTSGDYVIEVGLADTVLRATIHVSQYLDCGKIVKPTYTIPVIQGSKVKGFAAGVHVLVEAPRNREAGLSGVIRLAPGGTSGSGTPSLAIDGDVDARLSLSYHGVTGVVAVRLETKDFNFLLPDGVDGVSIESGKDSTTIGIDYRPGLVGPVVISPVPGTVRGVKTFEGGVITYPADVVSEDTVSLIINSYKEVVRKYSSLGYPTPDKINIIVYNDPSEGVDGYYPFFGGYKIYVNYGYLAKDAKSSEELRMSLKRVVAHETFHCVQYIISMEGRTYLGTVYTLARNRWVLEMTATWAEYAVYPEDQGYCEYCKTFSPSFLTKSLLDGYSGDPDYYNAVVLAKYMEARKEGSVKDFLKRVLVKGESPAEAIKGIMGDLSQFYEDFVTALVERDTTKIPYIDIVDISLTPQQFSDLALPPLSSVIGVVGIDLKVGGHDPYATGFVAAYQGHVAKLVIGEDVEEGGHFVFYTYYEGIGYGYIPLQLRDGEKRAVLTVAIINKADTATIQSNLGIHVPRINKVEGSCKESEDGKECVLTLKGYFGLVQGSILVNGSEAVIESWSDTEVRIRVGPAIIDDGKYLLIRAVLSGEPTIKSNSVIYTVIVTKKSTP